MKGRQQMTDRIETGEAPDVARDEKVVARRAELLEVLKRYIEEAKKFDETGEWQAEVEMLHTMQYDIPRVIKAVDKAMRKFYRKHPDGIVHN